MERKYEAVGIDLGTTYSAIAYVDQHGDSQVVKNPDDQRPILPSAVFFDEGDIVVGENALEQSHVYPKQVAQFVKRSMGDPKGLSFGGKRHTPETISAIILKKLVNYAEPVIGKIEKAVVTVPAFFNEKRRAATEHAGTIAGLEVIGTLNEPAAALIAYGLHEKSSEQTHAVYDLGGGTFDVTVMRVGGGKNGPVRIQELATGGNRELGGIDWDRALVDYVADEFVKACAVDPRDDAISFQALCNDCRRAKQTLSKLRRTTVQCTHAGRFHRVELTRDRFERLTRSLLAKTEMTVEACIRDAGLTWGQVDGVVLIGGSTRMPMVREMVRRVSGKEPLTRMDPDLAVAIGAAHYAGVLETRGKIHSVKSAPAAEEDEDDLPRLADEESEDDLPRLADEDDDEDDDDLPCLRGEGGEPSAALANDEPSASPADEEDDIEVGFVNPHGIGVFARQDGRRVNFVMIPRNSKLPIERTRQFTTARDGVDTINLTISEGDTKQREACEILGKCVLGPLPESLAQGSPINLSLGYDRNGRVRVSALCQTTGTQVEAEIQAFGILSDDEVRQEREYFADLSIQ